MGETQARTHMRLLCCSCLPLQLPSSVAVHAQELQGSAMYLIHRLAFFIVDERRIPFSTCSDTSVLSRTRDIITAC